jgi:hypothetical protein
VHKDPAHDNAACFQLQTSNHNVLPGSAFLHLPVLWSFFFGEQGEQKRVKYANASQITRALSGGRDERFYVVDDLENKYFSSPPHFVGAPNRKTFNSITDAVLLDPNQEITETLRFDGSIPSGNTRLTFVSPHHNGHQIKIEFRDVVLK